MEKVNKKDNCWDLPKDKRKLKINRTFINEDIVVKEFTNFITFKRKMIWDVDITMIQTVMKMKILSVSK